MASMALRVLFRLLIALCSGSFAASRPPANGEVVAVRTVVERVVPWFASCVTSLIATLYGTSVVFTRARAFF